MATNASKFTGIQNTVVPEMGIDVEQIKADAQDLTQAENYSDLTVRLATFIQKHPETGQRVQRFMKSHPLLVKAGIAGAGLGALVGPVAASDDSAFGINGTQIDGAFDILNHHLLPSVGQTISAMPSIVIPLVILIVLIIIMLFVPELLYSLIDMLKGALKFKR
nr:hypothetical protein [uncultured Methanoregula sp.]